MCEEWFGRITVHIDPLGISHTLCYRFKCRPVLLVMELVTSAPVDIDGHLCIEHTMNVWQASLIRDVNHSAHSGIKEKKSADRRGLKHLDHSG